MPLHHTFNFAARDSEAERYFLNGNDSFDGRSAFMRHAEDAINYYMVSCGKDYCRFSPGAISLQDKDTPLAQEAFAELQAKYPELKNIRIHKGEIIIDSRKNSLHRRVHVNQAFPVHPRDGALGF